MARAQRGERAKKLDMPHQPAPRSDNRLACGADGWAMTASGTRGVLNDAISVYFADPTLASAFVARWCVGSKIETAGGRVPGERGRASAADGGGDAQDAPFESGFRHAVKAW